MLNKYTDEQVRRARSTNLEHYLRSRGEKLVRSGPEWRWVYRDSTGEHDSVTIKNGEWYDHKRGIGGDAIGFLQEFMSVSFREAVAILLNGEQPSQEYYNGYSSPIHIAANEEQPKEFVLPTKNSNMHRMYAYLTKTRFLAGDVIAHFVQAGALYEDAKYHNAVFLGLDEEGTAHSAILKETLSRGSGFRQTLTGSDTRYAFHHKGASGKLYVFEAPIDLLSFISMRQRDWKQHSYIALDGLSAIAMHQFLSVNPQISQVYLCLDNDAAGIEAADKFRDDLEAKGYTGIKRLASIHKDWNEDIKARRGDAALPAQSHPKIDAYHNTVDMLRSAGSNNYAQFVAEQGIPSAAANIRRELSRLGDDPYSWEPDLLRTATLCALAAKHLQAGDILFQLALEYKPYIDKGRLKSHAGELYQSAQEVYARPDADTLKRLADACIRTMVYLQTDYLADLARQDIITDQQKQLELDLCMSLELSL